MVRVRPSPAAPPARFVAEGRRVLDELLRSVDGALTGPPPSVGRLHRLHRGMRQLRTWLALWPEFVEGRQRRRIRALDRRLRRLARRIGAARDRDIARALLRRFPSPPRSDPERSRLVRYRSRLDRDARAGRGRVRARLRAEQEAGLFTELVALFERPPRTIAPPRLRRALAAGRARARRQFSEALVSARRRPTVARLHRLRVRVRRLRQLDALASRLERTAPGPTEAPLRRLQYQLGRVHDVDLVFLELDRRFPGSRWTRRLQKERRRLRRAVLAGLGSGANRPDPGGSPSPAGRRAGRALRRRAGAAG